MSESTVRTPEAWQTHRASASTFREAFLPIVVWITTFSTYTTYVKILTPVHCISTRCPDVSLTRCLRP
ncbi:MAG: hypothetical protein E7383_10485 [Ruminococcaceae bacterium]|nr:hypothetical protein [Oscillospiraceae bacterium]